jgi:hypothetical protein
MLGRHNSTVKNLRAANGKTVKLKHMKDFSIPIKRLHYLETAAIEGYKSILTYPKHKQGRHPIPLK